MISGFRKNIAIFKAYVFGAYVLCICHRGIVFKQLFLRSPFLNWYGSDANAVRGGKFSYLPGMEMPVKFLTMLTAWVRFRTAPG